MSKNNRLSRDQQRKAKLKKRAARSTRHESLAYRGSKYQTEEYVSVMHRTETGIYESYVVLDRKLTDYTVEAAIESLIVRLRQRQLTPLSELGPQPGIQDEQDFIAWNIVSNWRILAENQALPGRDDLIGVLRTILSSLETWRSQKMSSKGYLEFLEGFMKETGVSVTRGMSAESFLNLAGRAGLLEDDDFDEPIDDALLELGNEWVIDKVPDAEKEFAEAVGELLVDGEGERVVEVCRLLMVATGDVTVISRLNGFISLGEQLVKNEG
jgi:hypothetical protein